MVDEDAAQIVRLIFHKYVYEGYGGHRLCRYLSEIGVRKPDGNNFPPTSIIRTLKNPIYIGIVHNGEAQSEPIPELQIIDNEVFDRAQRMMVERTTHHGTTPLNTRGKSLLVGNVFCGHCGHPLTLTTNGKRRIIVDGVKTFEPSYRYICHHNYRHPGVCDGPSGYGMRKLDDIVDKVISYQLSQIQASSAGDMIAQQHEKAVELAQARCNMAEKQLSDKAKELADYQAETIKVIRGESRLDIDLLNDLVARCKTEIETLTDAVAAAKADLQQQESGASREMEEYQKLENWAEIYDNCTLEAKKMIISQFVKSVRVFRDYTLEIEYNVSFEDFREMGIMCESHPNKAPEIYVTH